MEESQSQASVGELMDQILAMPEYKLRQDLLGLNTSIYIFDTNYTELRRIIEFLTDDPNGQLLTAAENRDRLHNVQVDVLRRLHNFVAATQSLIDHTRRLHTKLYSESGTFPEYQDQVEARFVNDPLSQFVQRLRQYCQHYKAPDIGIKVSVRRTERGFDERRVVFLGLDNLREFDGWNAPAKLYMDDLPEEVDVLEVVTQYRDKVIEFYRWFQSRQLEIHASDLARFEAKQTQLALLNLEWNVNACLNNKSDMPFRGEEIYIGILSSQELEELERIPTSSPERLSRAIEFIGQRLTIPPALKSRMADLYRESAFFAPRTRHKDDAGGNLP
jgi:hypothetical protein